MAKQLLKERFQQLAGLKSLYELDSLPRDNEDEGYYVIYQSHKSQRGGDGVDASNASTSKEFKKFPFTDEPTSKEAREEAHKQARMMNNNEDRFTYTVGQYNPYSFISK